MAESKLDPQFAIKVLTKHNGMISKAARELGVARMTLYRLMEREPSVRDAVDDAKECMIDEAEAQLHKAIKKGAPWAIQFYLKTQGKGRGYVDRQEITGANGAALQIEAELKNIENKSPKEISQLYQELSRGSSSSK